MNERLFHNIPEGTSFELLFRWGEAWADIHVYPVNTSMTSTHYIVRLAKNLEVIIRLNEIGEWEEMHDGVTELAQHLGKAIDAYSSMYRKF